VTQLLPKLADTYKTVNYND